MAGGQDQAHSRVADTQTALAATIEAGAVAGAATEAEAVEVVAQDGTQQHQAEAPGLLAAQLVLVGVTAEATPMVRALGPRAGVLAGQARATGHQQKHLAQAWVLALLLSLQRTGTYCWSARMPSRPVSGRYAKRCRTHPTSSFLHAIWSGAANSDSY